MCEGGPVGQWVCVLNPDEPKISTKLGKNWNESKPYFSERVGLSPAGIGPRSVRLFHGPAALASITHSIGFEYGVRRDGSPENEYIRCGPFSRYARASVNGLGWSNASRASAVTLPNDDACRKGP